MKKYGILSSAWASEVLILSLLSQTLSCSWHIISLSVLHFLLQNMGLLFSNVMFISQEPKFKQGNMEQLSLGCLEFVKQRKPFAVQKKKKKKSSHD